MRLILSALIASSMMVPATGMAAAPPGGKPSISIVSPALGTTVHGSTVTVQVKVANFKLVKPVLLTPSKWHTIPLLKGNQGHIHYVLDSMANMVLTRDVVVSTSHTWTNVSPGRHTIIAYLANSQHAPFPGTQPAKIQITVAPPMRQQQKSQTSQTNSSTPSIAITGYRIVHSKQGATILVNVRVSHFKLMVPSMTNNPPLLPGNQGHIHYVLDSMANFVTSKDSSMSMSHPWTDVTPGHHTLIALLVNSQHQLFPGTKPAEIQITVPPGAATSGRTALSVGTLPPTGGAAGNASAPLAPPWVDWVVIAAGLGFLLWIHRRRFLLG